MKITDLQESYVRFEKNKSVSIHFERNIAFCKTFSYPMVTGIFIPFVSPHRFVFKKYVL